MKSATWLKIDIHLHMPGTGQYFTMPSGETEPSSNDERLAFARRYLKQAREEAGLDLIAITNHNDTSWILPLQQAAQELYGDDFVVLPGLEIGSDSGLNSIHVLAIFPETTEPEILERLMDDDLGLTKDKRFDESGAVLPTTKSFADTLQHIKGRGGIAVAAHAFSTEDSLLGSKSNRGKSREQQFVLPKLAAIDLASFTVSQLAEKQSGWGFWIVTNQHNDPNLGRDYPIALLNNSDARTLEDVGKQFTWIKGKNPGFQAFQNALRNPEDRVRLRDDPPNDESLWKNDNRWMYTPPSTPASYIKYIELADTPSGFLRQLQVDLHPELNCIIGGRGSGKSAIIELLRYTWGYTAPEEVKGFENIFLPQDAVVIIGVATNETTYRIKKVGRNEPVVQRYEDGSWHEVDGYSPQQLISLHIYGQKEILKTSRDMSSQLDLVDGFIEVQIEKLKRDQQNIRESLRLNRESIFAEFRSHDSLTDEVSALPGIQEQLRTYQALGVGEMADIKILYDQEKQIWEKSRKDLDEITAILDRAEEDLKRIKLSYLREIDLSELIHRQLFSELYRILSRLIRNEQKVLTEGEQSVKRTRNNLRAKELNWKARFGEFEKTYFATLEKIPGITPEVIVELEANRSELEGKRNDLNEIKAEIKRLLDERSSLLEELHDNAKQQFQLRTEKTSELTRRLSRVRVSAIKNGDTISFAKYFKREFKVVRMRDEHYRSIAACGSQSLLSLLALVEKADQDTPEEFIVYSRWMPEDDPKKHVETNAISQLAGFSGLDDESWAQKLVDRLDFKSRLMLDEFVTPDRILVEVNIAKNHQRDNWRALGKELGQGVSVGQGCTAILSIILLESEDPLIIDQPEDDLDNRFIYHEVVGLLRKERGKRQVIVATHNANIPVAGDAEMVIALDTEEPSDGSSSELQCVPAAAGFIDNTDVRDQITLILEGGEEAFRLRRQKYGF